MGKETGISWTDHTFNVVEGCAKVSPGCKHCYAEAEQQRHGRTAYWGPAAPRKPMSAAYWREPRKWHREALAAGVRRRVCCGSVCDVFEDHATVTAERAKLWPLIRETPGLDWLLLTKRADRIAESLPADWGPGYPNVWLGVSIEDAAYVWRADALAKVPAVVRFVSYEPALGPLADTLCLLGIDWLIYGGESGPHYRPDNPDWARAMRGRCRVAAVAFWYKQAAGRWQGTTPTLDGATVQELPTPRVVRPVPLAADAGPLFAGNRP